MPPWIIFLWIAGGAWLHAQDRVLILRTDDEKVQEVVTSMEQEFDGQLDVRHQLVSTSPTADSFEQIATFLDEHDPQLIVLMNNAILFDYRRFQIRYPDRELPPAVVCMAALLEQEIEGMRNITGVSYEVPAVISFNFVRTSITRPVVKIGVIYRQRFQGFIESQRKLAEVEGFEIVGYPIEHDERNHARAIRKGLRFLQNDENIDALWILNDNSLINADMINRAWRPRLRGVRMPIVVGVLPLVRMSGLGNFAVLPNHSDLGHQVGDLILYIRDEGWNLPPNSKLVYEPTSKEKAIDLEYARRYFGFIESKLPEIDIVDP